MRCGHLPKSHVPKRPIADGDNSHSLMLFFPVLINKILVEEIGFPSGNSHRLIYQVMLYEGFSDVFHGNDAR